MGLEMETEIQWGITSKSIFLLKYFKKIRELGYIWQDYH